MTIGAVAPDLGAVGFATKGVFGEPSVNLRVARRSTNTAARPRASRSIAIAYRFAASSTLVRFVNTC